MASRTSAKVMNRRSNRVGLADQRQAYDAARDQHQEGGDPAEDLALGRAAGGQQAPVLGGQQLRPDIRDHAWLLVLSFAHAGVWGSG
jgi:hypothetical protein